MIQIQNLNKSFGAQSLFDDVTLHVNAGEKIGLVGRNGHGKSTLLRMIEGKDHPDSGEILVPSGYRVGVLNQHLSFSEPTLREELCLALSPSQSRLTRGEGAPALNNAYQSPPDKEDLGGFEVGEAPVEVWKAEKMAHGIGFSQSDLDKAPTEFSGGYQIRIMLAKLLLTDPDLLLLDEPTNYLDIVALQWLTDFLKGWKKEFILITHDRIFMDRVVTHTVAIHRQGLKKVRGNTHKVYQQIREEEEIHEKTRLNDEKKTAKQEKFIREFRAGARSAGLVQSRVKMLAKQEKLHKLKPIPKIKFHFSEQEFTGDRIMNAHNLSFGYESPPEQGESLKAREDALGHKGDLGDLTDEKISPSPSLIRGETVRDLLIKKLNLEIYPGDRIGIIGKNGRGKSTLLKLLSEQLKPLSGSVRLHPSVRLGVFNQTNQQTLNLKRSIYDELQQSAKEIPEKEIRRLCGSLMFPGDLAFKKLDNCSGGERARVLVGKIMLQPVSALLLDEPTNHFDLESIEALIAALNKFEGAVVIVSHNEDLLEKVVNKLVVFDDNDVTTFSGHYSDFIKERGWQENLDEAFADKNITLEKHLPVKRTPSKSARKQLREALRPIKRKLDQVEKEILALEEKMMLNKADFDKAFRQGNRLKMETLGLEYDDLKSQVLSRQENWDGLSEQYLKIESDFSE